MSTSTQTTPPARMKRNSSPPAQLDGTGLLQMPLHRAESPEAKQDNCIKWKHMRNMRSQQRHHEPNETPRLNATHKHQRRSNNAPLTRPYPSPQHDGHILHHRGTKQNLRNIPESSIAYTRRLNCFIPEGSIAYTRRLNAEGSFLLNKVHIPKAHFYFYFYFLPIGTEEGSIAYTRRLNCFIPEGSIVHTRRLNCCRKPPTPPSGDLRTPPLGCLPHPSCPANSFAEKEPRHDNWRNVTILAGSGHRRTTHAGVHEPVNIASAPAGRYADAPLLLSQARQNFILPKSRSEVSSFYLTRSRGTSEFVKYII